MTSPTTAIFNLPIDDVIDQAYGRVFGEDQTGYDLRSANINLSLLFQEFQVRGDPLWKIEQYDFPIMAADGGVYTLPENIVDIREMWLQDLTLTPPGDDLTIARIPRATYELIPNKKDPGRSYQAYVDRQRDAPIVKLYPVVNTDNNYQFYYSAVTRLYDIGTDYTQNIDTPVRWLPTVISGLAWYVARNNRIKLAKLLNSAADAKALIDDLHVDFEACYATSSIEDSDSSPTRIEVDASAYFGR